MKPRLGVGLVMSCGLLTMVAVREAAAEQPAALVVGGELSTSEGAAVRAAAAAAVEAAGWTVGGAELSSGAELLSCFEGPRSERDACLARVVERAEVERAVVLRASRTTQEGHRARLVRGWVFRKNGRALAFEQRFCEGRCPPAQLADTARTLVELLVRGARAEATPSSLWVRSVPPGAQIRVDDKVVGATDMEFRVYPGRHLVRLDKPGFAPATRELVIDDGEKASIEVTLEQRGEGGPARPGPPPRRPRARAPVPGAVEEQSTGSRSRLMPWLVMGTGAAALVGGGVLLAVDQGEAGDGSLRGPDFTDTTPIGLALGAAGVAAVSVGLYLWLRPGGADEQTGTAPVVWLDRESAWVGVQAGF